MTETPFPAPVGVPRILLRLEGLAVLAAATVAYAASGQPWWLFAVLFFVPDVAMAAYLAGPRIGAVAYNAAHSYIGPVALGLAGYLSGRTPIAALALIWVAHIGFDRALGYGLKYASAFGDTHLGRIGRAR